MRNYQKSRGFTLIELVIVIIIVAILSAVISRVLIAASNAYFVNKASNEATLQARMAFQYFADDIYPLSKASLTTATSSQIIYTSDTGTTTTYAISGTVMTKDGNTLLANVNSAASYFSFYDKDLALLSAPVSAGNLPLIRYVFLRMNLQIDNVDQTLQTMIALRNN